MKLLKRFIFKGSLRLLGTLIKLIAPYNVRLYMRFYLWYLRKRGMDIKGDPIYISMSCWFDGTDYGLISIGDQVVISSLVRVLTHDYSVSRALVAVGEKLDSEVSSVRRVEIGDNCFVGVSTILMPGVKLGKNVIVGAGSVVRGDVPDNSIVLGNPAEVVGNTLELGESRRKLLAEGKLRYDPSYWADKNAVRLRKSEGDGAAS